MSRERAPQTHGAWWRYIAAGVLVFDGAMVVVYGRILPLPQWLIDLPLLGTVPWVALLAGAILVAAGIGVARRAKWARVAGIVVALAYAAVAIVLLVQSGSIPVLIELVVPAVVVFVLAFRWDAGGGRGALRA